MPSDQVRDLLGDLRSYSMGVQEKSAFVVGIEYAGIQLRADFIWCFICLCVQVDRQGSEQKQYKQSLHRVASCLEPQPYWTAHRSLRLHGSRELGFACESLGCPRAMLPTPHQPIFRVDHFAAVFEPA